MKKKVVFRQTLSIYANAAWQYPWRTIGMFVLVPVGVFFNNIIQPLLIATAIDRLTGGHIDSSQIWEKFHGLILAFVVCAILGELIVWRLIILNVWSMERRVVRDLYKRCFDHLALQSAKFHADRFSGSLVSQTNKFTGAYVRLADSVFLEIGTLLSATVMTLIILGIKLPQYSLALAILMLLFMAVALTSFKKVRQLSEQEAAANTKLSGQIADMVTNLLAVKSFAAEKHEKKRFALANQGSYDAESKVMWAVTKRDFGFGAVLSAMSIVAFLALVGGEAWFGVSLGTLILAISYTMQMLQRMWDFNRMLRNFNRGLGDAYDMTEILNTPVGVTDAADSSELAIKKGNITFENVTFTHTDSKDDALFEGLSLTIHSGQKIGLVGHSGSGKTTLTKLLLRFSDLDGGRILIDGQDIAKVSQHSLRSAIAYVPQEPLLFHRSLSENIAYAVSKPSLAGVTSAAKKANALEFIEKLPRGFETLVGERGVKLSGGQRQRVAIARAIMKDAPILVLDEATSALDSLSEKLIQSALGELMKNRTSIVIAHRLSTVQSMDRIIVLHDGKIAEEGSHQELLDKNGTYAELWSHQSGGFLED